ncbi:hypothetical protein [Pseudonocardia spinosispora]|uniref:hypothetical protein n=1 Tax=Pseudonocardia spinosispora TaxID=103441 RepID=UPI0003FE2527|nr:hypothetical protein [Pseudonocardia spinosispora]
MCSVLDGYRAAGGPALVAAVPEAFGSWVGSWVWWLDFQLEESIAAGVDPENGIEQATSAMDSLRQTFDELDAWTALLRTRQSGSLR